MMSHTTAHERDLIARLNDCNTELTPADRHGLIAMIERLRRDAGYVQAEREHLGDPDKRTGIYAGRELAKASSPDGWKAAPIEPTEDMIVNGFESWPDQFFSTSEVWEAFEKMSGCAQAAHKAKLCYAAMLDAAPSLPSEREGE
ncbi:hypothetical protein [Burkholderia gladioli]|uniref:hypothetical protein n=1 Tax=Burkholderia gladioli TaxID=28095 RepID=UPI00163ECA11|nr:hypothetical protein [Burkholderia gladioli]